MRHAMPRHLIFLFLFITIFSNSQAGAVDIVTGLDAYWKLDGNALDSSGKGNDGTVNGATVTADRFGKPDGAMFFDGNSSISVGSADLLHNGKGTFAAWIKVKSSAAGVGVNNYIVAKGNDLTIPGWGADVICRADACFLAGMMRGAVNGWFESPYNLPNDDQWHFIVLEFGDRADQRMYIDGVSQTVGCEGNCSVADVQEGSYPFNIGKTTRLGDSYNFNGAVDDIRIYDRALTDADVTALYHLTNNSRGMTVLRNIRIGRAVIR